MITSALKSAYGLCVMIDVFALFDSYIHFDTARVAFL